MLTCVEHEKKIITSGPNFKPKFKHFIILFLESLRFIVPLNSIKPNTGNQKDAKCSFGFYSNKSISVTMGIT